MDVLKRGVISLCSPWAGSNGGSSIAHRRRVCLRQLPQDGAQGAEGCIRHVPGDGLALATESAIFGAARSHKESVPKCIVNQAKECRVLAVPAGESEELDPDDELWPAEEEGEDYIYMGRGCQGRRAGRG